MTKLQIIAQNQKFQWVMKGTFIDEKTTSVFYACKKTMLTHENEMKMIRNNSKTQFTMVTTCCDET